MLRFAQDAVNFGDLATTYVSGAASGLWVDAKGMFAEAQQFGRRRKMGTAVPKAHLIREVEICNQPRK